MLNIIARGLVAVPSVGPQQFWPLAVWQRQRLRFFGVALVSSLALRWRHCQQQAFLVASVAPALLPSWPSKVRLVPRWRLLELCLRFCPHPAGIIASIVLLPMLPALCRHHCPCHMGAFALVALASLPVLGPAKIGSASALSGFPLKFVKRRRQHRRPLILTPPPTDAMGDSSLFFVLAFLGRQKIGSASALSGFPLKIFLRGRTKQRRQPLTIRMGTPMDAMGDSSLFPGHPGL